jgi:peptidyl-prolyl cis-trans isomerase A (cyclophilin A)
VSVKIKLLFVTAALCLSAQEPQRTPREFPRGLYAIFETEKGKFTAVLYEKDTPNTVRAFIGVAQGTLATIDPATRKPVRRRYYDGVTFHRVVRGQMIQAGDPTGTGAFSCGFTIADEILPGLRFTGGGKLAMANTGQPNSGGCQFFVTVGPMQTWSGNYTIFGNVVEGLDVVEAINKMPGREDRPLNPVKIERVTIQRVGPMPVVKRKR